MRSNIVSARKVAGWNNLRQDMTRRRRLLVRKTLENHNVDPAVLAARQMMVDMKQEIADLVD